MTLKIAICHTTGCFADPAAGLALITATIDPAHQARVRARDPLLADRRATLYRSLTA